MEFSLETENIKHIFVSEKYLLLVEKTMFSGDKFLTVFLLFLLLTEKVPRDKDDG